MDPSRSKAHHYGHLNFITSEMKCLPLKTEILNSFAKTVTVVKDYMSFKVPKDRFMIRTFESVESYY